MKNKHDNVRQIWINGVRKTTPEYKSWQHMRSRCMNSTNAAYSFYGGRGIKICRGWEDFDNFIQDMGPKPTPKHSIDRIDVNGDYEPLNCRWANTRQQSLNRRLYTTNKSGYRGVHWLPESDKWAARLSTSTARISLGNFASKEEAALVYDCAAIQFNGYDARLNIL